MKNDLHLEIDITFVFARWLSLLRAGALAQLPEVLKKYNILFVALHEKWWKDTVILRTKEYIKIYSGNSTNHLAQDLL